jgi:hypothetical protein
MRQLPRLHLKYYSLSFEYCVCRNTGKSRNARSSHATKSEWNIYHLLNSSELSSLCCSCLRRSSWLLFFAVTFEPIFVGHWFINIWTNVVHMNDYASLVFSSISLDLIRPRNIISVSHRFGNCYFPYLNSTKTFVSNFDQLDCDSHLVFIYFSLRRVGNVFLLWRISYQFPSFAVFKNFCR